MPELAILFGKVCHTTVVQRDALVHSAAVGFQCSKSS
jgi:hypothetical protein